MSHFVGLVINTPSYMGDVEDALEKYDENITFDEYRDERVSDWAKLRFMTYYSKKWNMAKLAAEFVNESGITIEGDENGVLGYAYRHPDEFTKFVLKKYPKILYRFSAVYKKHGWDWNDNSWRKDGKVWYSYTTYNPYSKWDWYCVGGRWECVIKIKDGTFVNEALLGDIYWSEPTDDEKWQLSADHPPFCVIIDGEWYEKGEMGWWCMTTNEKDTKAWSDEFHALIEGLPIDSDVTLVDFHI